MTIIKGLCEMGDLIEIDGVGYIVCNEYGCGNRTEINGIEYRICNNCMVDAL